MSFTAGVMPSCWWLDGATRVGGGRRNKSSRSKEGDTVTMVAVGGPCDESTQ